MKQWALEVVLLYVVPLGVVPLDVDGFVYSVMIKCAIFSFRHRTQTVKRYQTPQWKTVRETDSLSCQQKAFSLVRR